MRALDGLAGKPTTTHIIGWVGSVNEDRREQCEVQAIPTARTEVLVRLGCLAAELHEWAGESTVGRGAWTVAKLDGGHKQGRQNCAGWTTLIGGALQAAALAFGAPSLLLWAE